MNSSAGWPRAGRSEWVLTMIEHMPMSLPTREELLRRFGPVDDPEIEERRQYILRVLLESSPQAQQQLIDRGTDGRSARRVPRLAAPSARAPTAHAELRARTRASRRALTKRPWSAGSIRPSPRTASSTRSNSAGRLGRHHHSLAADRRRQPCGAVEGRAGKPRPRRQLQPEVLGQHGRSSSGSPSSRRSATTPRRRIVASRLSSGAHRPALRAPRSAGS